MQKQNLILKFVSKWCKIYQKSLEYFLASSVVPRNTFLISFRISELLSLESSRSHCLDNSNSFTPWIFRWRKSENSKFLIDFMITNLCVALDRFQVSKTSPLLRKWRVFTYHSTNVISSSRTLASSVGLWVFLNKFLINMWIDLIVGLCEKGPSLIRTLWLLLSYSSTRVKIKLLLN